MGRPFACLRLNIAKAGHPEHTPQERDSACIDFTDYFGKIYNTHHHRERAAMISRRHFIAAAAASAVLPTLPAQAQGFQIAPKYVPQPVSFLANYAPGQILIVPGAHFLYYITETGQAMRYGVGLGKAGQEISGSYVVGSQKEWPTWRPTDAMIERDPQAYGKFIDNDYVQPGGPGNPLGARALYLYRDGRYTFNAIHGTTSPQSIGRSVSNGCVRMINEHVMDLYNRVPIGTKVTVI